MTKEEKIIATAFTGKMFVEGSDMGLLYEYMEKKVGHKVFDLILADKGFWEKLHKACEQDFINMVSKEQPSLPSEIDEAAKEYAKTTFKKPYSDNPDEEVTIVEPDKYAGFIAGAKWDKEQMMSNAVEGYVTLTLTGVRTVAATIKGEDNIGLGDKVRVIVCKRED